MILGSNKNGTVLNGQPIQAPTMLADGAVIVLGRLSEFRVFTTLGSTETVSLGDLLGPSSLGAFAKLDRGQFANRVVHSDAVSGCVAGGLAIPAPQRRIGRDSVRAVKIWRTCLTREPLRIRRWRFRSQMGKGAGVPSGGASSLPVV